MSWLKKYRENYAKNKDESDEYGYKEMLREMNEIYRCPEDGAFLVWADDGETLQKCPRCKYIKRVKGFTFR
jgi:hypothetical protein